MSNSKKGDPSKKVAVYDPLEATMKQPQPNPFHAESKRTVPLTMPQPLTGEDATIQVPIRTPFNYKPTSAGLLDDAATEVLSRQELFAQAARIEHAVRNSQTLKQQNMEMTTERPRLTDYLPDDIRPTIATPAIGEHTIADQEIVKVGSWREFIVEVDDQLCLIVPIEIARSGLLKPGRRLVARIRTLDE